MWGPTWPRGSVLGLRPPGFEFQILCLEGRVISLILRRFSLTNLACMYTKAAYSPIHFISFSLVWYPTPVRTWSINGGSQPSVLVTYLGPIWSSKALNQVIICQSPGDLTVRPKKKYCLFPISDRPCQNMCDPNLFYGFPKKKKKFFFFFLGNP